MSKRALRDRYGYMLPSFELFDHTADMGLRIRGASMPELLLPAACALYTAIGSLVPEGDAETRRIELNDDSAAYLLRDFLAELLAAVEQESRMVTAIDNAVFNQRTLTADLQVRTVSSAKSVFDHEVKAITYHELVIHSIPGGYEATVIVDI